MFIAASVFVVLAGVLHGYIFLMESAWWTRPTTWKRFGVGSQAEADTTRAMAYNQGFYNLFLGIGAIVGVIMFWAGITEAGTALALFTTACMTLAAIVLTTTGPGYGRAAVTQGTLPFIGLVLFTIGTITA